MHKIHYTHNMNHCIWWTDVLCHNYIEARSEARQAILSNISESEYQQPFFPPSTNEIVPKEVKSTRLTCLQATNRSITIHIFLDLSSAFNTTQPHLMLNTYGIKWFHAFLTGRTQQVRVKQTLSKCRSTLIYTVHQ